MYFRNPNINHRFKNIVVSLVLVLILSSCATQAPRDTDAENVWLERQQSLQSLREWELKGRIAIITQQDSGSANLYWKQTTEGYTIRIFGPFGRGSMTIQGSSQGVIIRNSKGESITADTPERLIQQQTGWFIPVSNLRSWVVGLTAGTQERYQLDKLGRLEGIKSEGWDIQYQRYKTFADNELPTKLRLESSDITIKLAISDWEQ